MLFIRWRGQDLYFLPPSTAAPGIEPTSRQIKLYQTGTFRTLYRLSYSVAAKRRTWLEKMKWIEITDGLQDGDFDFDFDCGVECDCDWMDVRDWPPFRKINSMEEKNLPLTLYLIDGAAKTPRLMLRAVVDKLGHFIMRSAFFTVKRRLG